MTSGRWENSTGESEEVGLFPKTPPYVGTGPESAPSLPPQQTCFVSPFIIIGAWFKGLSSTRPAKHEEFYVSRKVPVGGRKVPVGGGRWWCLKTTTDTVLHGRRRSRCCSYLRETLVVIIM
eukprot:CAMPEP_0185797966 /NCGR_PEP_ID=MMETSP1174-20130828/161896_1 /TAXON_ID=35687 /ORGANISM="Dictyocha speculum, Strain CCMP1381" /LENGTH=120 /DNA_ID=CAMNT_0028493431 /DNA_START=567 /DNA_END=929 /DNA_ORIENTATION=-